MTTTPTLWSGPRQANTVDSANGASTQNAAKVIGLSGGGFVIAWEDDTDRTMLGARDIIGQVYDALGRKVGGETILSFIYNDDDQKSVDLAAFRDGSFLTAYQTTDAAGAGDGENVTVERHQTDDSFQGVDDFRGPANDTDPSVAAFANGSYALVYGNDASGNADLSFVFVDSGGVAAPAVAIENAVAASAPEIAALSNGRVGVVYQAASATDDVAFRIVTTAGKTVAQGIVGGNGNETAPEIAALKSGFVTVWQSDAVGNADIRFAIYDGSGNAVVANAPAQQTGTAGDQIEPSVTALGDGGFLIAWTDTASGDIQGQRFSATGAVVGQPVTLLGGSPDYADPDLALLADGRLVVTATRTQGDDDVVQAIWDPRDAVIKGTTGSDTIAGRLDGASLYGLAGADTLYGFAGRDLLDGGTGVDQLSGGAGDDTYVVDSVLDKVTESAGTANGFDTIRSTATIKLLANNVEALALIGSANLSGTGNSLANTVSGNAGANIIDGGLGQDLLSGSSGQDGFLFKTTLSTSNLDHIRDFRPVDDTIRLDNAVFKALTKTGALASGEFALITSKSAVVDADAHILYEKASGTLYYDANGGSGSGRIAFAVLDNHASLTFQDFLVV